MRYLPGSADDYKGEPVLYATGYVVDKGVIHQHLFVGLLLSLTIVGMILGVPLILRGYYLAKNIQKSIIITKKGLYSIDNGKQNWSIRLEEIEKVMWRSSLMGLMEIKIIDVFGESKIIKGAFYENEFHIIINTLRNRKP